MPYCLCTIILTGEHSSALFLLIVLRWLRVSEQKLLCGNTSWTCSLKRCKGGYLSNAEEKDERKEFHDQTRLVAMWFLEN